MLKNAIDWGTRPWGKSSWPGKPAAITGTSPAPSPPRSPSSICARCSAAWALHVMGGEAYIHFKPELIDAEGNVTDESMRGFLKTFIDQFAALRRQARPAASAA